MNIVRLGKMKIGEGNPAVLIAGPCVIEDEKSTMRHAERLKKITEKAKMPFIFKSSYDKANRTSIKSYRGPGIDKGLKILKKVKDSLGVFILSDVHTEEEAKRAGEVLDILQIPALLSRQTNLIVAAAKTKRIVNIKKGQFLSPWDMKRSIEKVRSAGNNKVIITERGTTFGYNNLVSDFRSILIMREFGVPVIYDASHSVQLPGSLGKASGGERRFIEPLIYAAVSVGADGIFVEVHEAPDKAPCDGPNMLPLAELPAILEKMKKIEKVI
ncbi:MAG: 3-deoxy-8-phosphooctulonate synthase [Candidatus Omnitrophota bacterium]